MQCPGQDRRYWTEDAVFEVPCPECGAMVEFFKDESSGRCGRCGHKFPNPGIDFGCAKWCSLAQQCVGFVPERQLTTRPGEGALAGRLIQEVKEALGADPARIARSMKSYHFAKELAAKEGGDPKIVLAAALVAEVGVPGSSSSADLAAAVSTVKRILVQVWADEELVGRVCAIFQRLQRHEEPDSAESRVVSDAVVLARIACDEPGGNAAPLIDKIVGVLKTNTAKEKARAMLKR